jgi:hypothetical protein
VCSGGSTGSNSCKLLIWLAIPWDFAGASSRFRLGSTGSKVQQREKVPHVEPPSTGVNKLGNTT